MRLPIFGLICSTLGGWAGLTAQPHSAVQRAPVIIQVDAAAPGDPIRPTWNYFGADEPNYTYAPHGQQLLGELAALTSAPVYVRLHNLLTTGDGTASLKWGSTNIYTESSKGIPIYDWTVTDRIFDALIHHGVHPIVEVGFMPEALSTHPSPYRHTFPAGDIFTGWSYPPSSFAKWEVLVAAWTHHLLERYGPNEVDTWLWEVWNEPDISYWHGTAEEYDRLYDYTAAGIQSVLPTARIGGPEVTGVTAGKSEAFLRQFLDHCDHGSNAATGKAGAPLAFISFHPKGSPRFVGDHVEMGLNRQLQSAQRGFQVVASYPRWKDTPIILGESDPEGCAACGGPQNGYRNGTLYGVSVVEATQRIGQLARQNGVTLQGAVNWAFEFEDQPIFAGFRDLATDGIDKPVLNALRLMGYLGGPGARQLPAWSNAALPLAHVLADGVRGRDDIDASASGSLHQVNVLVWNYHDDNVDEVPTPVVLRVNGLPEIARGHVQATRYMVDQEHANSYTAWLNMGAHSQIAGVQAAELQHAGQLSAEPQKFADMGDAVEIPFTLERQAVMVVRLTW